MKKLIFLSSIALLATINGIAQNTSNLIIFATDPTPFYAIVNGIRQNSEPQTNVKISGLTNNQNHVKVVFSDGVTPDIDKNFYFEKMNVEATARIVNTKKGYKLRYFGEVEMGQAAVNDQQVQIIYQTVDAPITSNTQTNNVAVEETITTTTTTSTNDIGKNVSNGTNDNVNMNVSIGGVDLNMNVNVTDNGINNNTQISDNVETTYTSTTTTTTTTSGGNFNSSNETQVVEKPAAVYVPGYTGRAGCTPPLSDVNSIKSAIESEDFSDDKIMVAKQALRGKCMSVQNIISISEVFDFEDKKLEFTKFAYDYTYDVDNYYQVNKVFDFSSSKEELNEYISSK